MTMLWKKKAGDPIHHDEWNELIRRASREVRGASVQSDSTGWDIIQQRQKPGALFRKGEVVCHGPDPDHAPSADNENYWVQFIDLLPKSVDGNTAPMETDTDENEIVNAENYAESKTHTHGVRVGTIVQLMQDTDTEGNLRWVFFSKPNLMTGLLGGLFGTGGERMVNNFGLIDTDHWETDSDIMPETVWRGLFEEGVARDIAFFKGVWWRAGNETITVGIIARDYGISYYDPDDKLWVGVPFATDEFGGQGYALYVWDRPGVGKRLYAAQAGFGVTPPHSQTEVVEIDFDPVTKTVTCTDIGWQSELGTDAICFDIIALSQMQKLEVTGDLQGGTFTLTIDDTRGDAQTTDPIERAATTEAIQAAIDAAIGKDRVKVYGKLPTIYFVFNNQAYKGASQADVEINTDELIGATGDSVTNTEDPALYFIGDFQGSGFNQIIKWDGTTWFDIGGPEDQIGQDITLRAICVHDFEDGNGPKLVTGGEFGIVDGVSGFQNVAIVETSGGTWEKIGNGVEVGGGSAVISLESFNHRLWAGAGYSISAPADKGTLQAFTNGPGAEWLSASDILSDLFAGGFFRYFWFDTDRDRIGISIQSMRVYDNKLHLAGDMEFRDYRRGMNFTGPFVRWNEPTTRWQGNLPFLRGKVNCLIPFNGGVFVGGKYSRTTPDGLVIRNAAVWYEPTTAGEDGSWDLLGGNMIGTVNAACVYNGDLYVAGTVSQVGGVAVKGIARFDAITRTWHYVANISDYGTINALAVCNGYLFIAGDFSAANGIVGNKIICKWDGQSLSDVFNDINSLDGLPIIRALYEHDGWLYLGGYFDEIDQAGITTANNIARFNPTSGVVEPLEDDDAGPSEGTRFGAQVWSIAHAPVSGQDWIFVGTDGKSLAGAFTDDNRASLWRWNPVSPDWQEGLVGTIVWGNRPCKAMAYDPFNAHLYIAVESKNSPGEVFPPKMRVWRLNTGTGAATSLGGLNGIFESDILALTYTNAGDSSRAYAGGSFTSVGNIQSDAAKLAQLICRVNTDDRIEDVAGGAGITGYLAQFTTNQFILRLRSIQVTKDEVQKATVGGTITGGTFTLTIDGVDTTQIAYNASEATIQAAVDAVVGADEIIVTGDLPEFSLTFSGEGYAGESQSLVVIDIDTLVGATSESVTRTVEAFDHDCGPHLAAVGTFGLTNDFYSQYLMGIDWSGNLASVRATLNGDWSLDQPGAFEGVHDIKAIPREEWPEYWEYMLGECEPRTRFLWAVVGNFFSVLHELISDDDLGTIPEYLPVRGHTLYNAGRFWAPTTDSHSYLPQAVECFQNKFITAGGTTEVPRFWNGDHTAGTWDEIADPLAAGNLFSNGGPWCLVRFEGRLWIIGIFYQQPSSSTFYAVASWTGSAFTFASAAGFASGSNPDRMGLCYTIGPIALDPLDKLYVGGQPNNPATECPVIVRTGAFGAAGTWAAVGTGLTGVCQSLCIIRHPLGSILIASGTLNVSGVGDCAVAMYDGTDWHAHGFINVLDVIYKTAAMSDSMMFDVACEKTRLRALIGGSLSEISKNLGDIGTADALPIFGVAEYHRAEDGSAEWHQVRGGAGCNGIVTAAADASKLLYEG